MFILLIKKEMLILESIILVIHAGLNKNVRLKAP